MNRIFFALTMPIIFVSGSCTQVPDVRSLENVSFNEAVKWSEDICLPSIAKNVFVYEQVSGTQDLERFYKFTVKVSDLGMSIAKAVAICDQKLGKKYTYTSGTIGRDAHVWPHWAKGSIAWWNPDSIIDGVYCISSEAYGLRIWADNNSGDIYIYQGD